MNGVFAMVKLMRISGSAIVINADMIETLEATPDTIITLSTGKKLILKDQIDEVIAKVVDYQKMVGGRISVIDHRNPPNESAE